MEYESGWYTDPTDADKERYWDGSSWTITTRLTGSTEEAVVADPYHNFMKKVHTGASTNKALHKKRLLARTSKTKSGRTSSLLTPALIAILVLLALVYTFVQVQKHYLNTTSDYPKKSLAPSYSSLDPKQFI